MGMAGRALGLISSILNAVSINPTRKSYDH